MWIRPAAFGALLATTACDDHLYGAPAEGPRTYTPDWDGVSAFTDDHCQVCHDEGRSQDFLVLPDALQRDVLLGDAYLVVPFDPPESKLWRVVSGDLSHAEPYMPPTGLLTEPEVAHIAAWIEAGAPVPAAVIDDDGDGVSPLDGDCDDLDPYRHPGAEELCDGIDNDCDGVADGADATGAAAWYPDLDQDSYGGDAGEVVQCDPPTGYIPVGGDCDDGDPAFRPGAPEPDCTDPTDWNCDGAVAAVDGDADGVVACLDCDDGDATAWPGAPELCGAVDEDCDGDPELGAVDAAAWYPDLDGDAHGDAAAAPVLACAPPAPTDVTTGDDCDDGNALVYPGADERCDGIDNDCDPDVDEGAIDATSWYPDGDGDGYGDATATPTLACAPPPGLVALGGDCDDGSAAFHPSAPETDCLDPADYNCDGATGMVDGDSDGFAACEECDDGDATVSPAGVETCDDRDEDCDGLVDDAPTDGQLWYPDDDADGYGDAADPGTLACRAPALGWEPTATDCDDALGTVNPGAVERCNGVDDDCAGGVDAGAVDAIAWYPDGDGDGDGALGSVAVLDCADPLPDHARTAGDCADGDPARSSLADEVCNGVDDDCSGVDDDDAVDAATWYPDLDDDGYGALGSAGFLDCALDVPLAAPTADDCDDAQPSVNPGATEVCNGIDDDCSTFADDDPVDGDLWFPDLDGDGYGDETDPGFRDCGVPVDASLDGTDCDDARDTVNPGVPFDAADGLDNDCDGALDEDGPAPSFAVDIRPILNDYCQGACHGPPVPSGGLNMSGAATYSNLVDRPSNDVPTMDRVEPFRTDLSYLWHKLNDTQLTVGGAGVQMPANAAGPPGGSSLPPAELATFEAWILSGALP